MSCNFALTMRGDDKIVSRHRIKNTIIEYGKEEDRKGACRAYK